MKLRCLLCGRHRKAYKWFQQYLFMYSWSRDCVQLSLSSQKCESQCAPWMQGVSQMSKECENLLSILQQEEFWSPCSIPCT